MPGRPLDTVPLTRRGAEYLDEDRAADDLVAVLELAGAEASSQPDHHYPTALSFATSGAPVVALPNQAATPAAGRVGYWSDGGTHAEVVRRSADGRRLFMDQDGAVFSTNVAAHLLRIFAGQVAQTRLNTRPTVVSIVT